MSNCGEWFVHLQYLESSGKAMCNQIDYLNLMGRESRDIHVMWKFTRSVLLGFIMNHGSTFILFYRHGYRRCIWHDLNRRMHRIIVSVISYHLSVKYKHGRGLSQIAIRNESI